MKKILAVLIIGYIILSVPFFAFGADGEVITITALELHQAFISNPTATEEQYLNKTIQLTGIVTVKGMSRYMTPNVELADHKDGTVLAICVLPRLDVGKLSNFKPGQKATFSGRVHRLTETRIILKECKAVE